jgi:hypothetical protein
MLFALGGVDWVRWFAAVGCPLLVVSSFAVVARDRAAAVSSPSPRVTLPRLLPVVAIYFALLAPLPDFALPRQAAGLLLFRR